MWKTTAIVDRETIVYIEVEKGRREHGEESATGLGCSVIAISIGLSGLPSFLGSLF
jgi:hypothetical protein